MVMNIGFLVELKINIVLYYIIIFKELYGLE